MTELEIFRKLDWMRRDPNRAMRKPLESRGSVDYNHTFKFRRADFKSRSIANVQMVKTGDYI